MSAADLTFDELRDLVTRVFAPGPEDDRLAVLVDLPDADRPDHAAWRDRRLLAAGWVHRLRPRAVELGYATALFAYPHVGANNADLPDRMVPVTTGGTDPASPSTAPAVSTEEVLGSHRLVVAVTELSATAPLKLMAPRLGFRAATMPGFARAMIPALRIDYGEVSRRVGSLCRLVTEAAGAELQLAAEGRVDTLFLDLRHRAGHASDGLVRRPGTAGNLPSGEAYIVPYEGEREGETSRSLGVLPVELEGEIVRYRVVGNRAVEVLGSGPVAESERDLLRREPAYGNVAELGLGVLADLGVEAVGSTLLDEKLGLHVAFGRSDHFGGVVGAADFSRPGAVVHIDRVYVDACQPRIGVVAVELIGVDGGRTPLMRDGRYVVALGG